MRPGIAAAIVRLRAMAPHLFQPSAPRIGLASHIDPESKQLRFAYTRLEKLQLGWIDWKDNGPAQTAFGFVEEPIRRGPKAGVPYERKQSPWRPAACFSPWRFA